MVREPGEDKESVEEMEVLLEEEAHHPQEAGATDQKEKVVLVQEEDLDLLQEAEEVKEEDREVLLEGEEDPQEAKVLMKELLVEVPPHLEDQLTVEEEGPVLLGQEEGEVAHSLDMVLPLAALKVEAPWAEDLRASVLLVLAEKAPLE